jgi:hypothetical protein
MRVINNTGWKFKKETLDELNKNLTPYEKMDLRIQKLREASENGLLQKARNRRDVGKILGYDTDIDKEKWHASAMITHIIQQRKALVEVKIGGNTRSNAEYAYYFQEPVARKKHGGSVKGSRRRVAPTPEQEQNTVPLWKDDYKPATEEQPVQVFNESQLDTQPQVVDGVSVTVELNGVVIKMTNPTAQYVAELVKELTKGE